MVPPTLLSPYLPLVSVLVNFAITDVVFIRHHQKQLIGIAVAYLSINFLATKIKGKPIYHFLTWQDAQSLYIVTAIVLGAVMGFNILVQLSELVKGRDAFSGISGKTK